MVQRYTPQVSSSQSGRSTRFWSTGASRGQVSGLRPCFQSGSGAYSGGYPYEQWHSHTAAQFEPRGFATARGEAGGFMLSVTGLNKFYFLKDFHDMRCKYERVLSIIHQQLNREPEEGDVFIVMSKNLRKVRLFSYDHRFYSLFEKRFRAGYKFMQVFHEGDELIYSIDWKDVVLLLESLVIKRLKIR